MISFNDQKKKFFNVIVFLYCFHLLHRYTELKHRTYQICIYVEYSSKTKNSNLIPTNTPSY